jgi:hypothetical protein
MSANGTENKHMQRGLTDWFPLVLPVKAGNQAYLVNSIGRNCALNYNLQKTSAWRKLIEVLIVPDCVNMFAACRS